MNKLTPTQLSMALLLAFGVGSAQAELLRVGPTSQVNGYPQWYQDPSGVVLEFCAPINQGELDGGHCLLLTGDTTLPEVFPSNFADEHFYWAGDAAVDTANGGGASLVLGLEAAFNAAVAPGEQVVFSRIRVRLNDVPMTGKYRFIHPYGEEILDGVAGERIFFTEDIGIACVPGDFECAMHSRLGPFLLPSNTPGGAELPPVTGPAPGKLYIADPARDGPVTGSHKTTFVDSQGNTRNHHIFRIEGPVGSNLGGPGIDFVETTNFTLMGRLYQGPIPGRVAVDRASYSRSSGANPQNALSVFATGEPTTQGRLPAQQPPAVVQPALSVYNAPCVENQVNGETVLSAPAGATETMMANAGSKYWAHTAPAIIPTAGICIKDNNATDPLGNPVATYVKGNVGDKVNIASAEYDPDNGGQLRVTVRSRDEQNPPTLSLEGYPGAEVVGNGTIVVTPLAAPPATVRVVSSARGSNQAQVEVASTATPPTDPGTGGGPVANADAAVAVEDDGPVVIPVLANDDNAAGGTVTLIALPNKGTAVVGAGGDVTYTPHANTNGADQFSYTVTLNGVTSNVALVGINVAPVNDAPVAVDDFGTTTSGTALDIPVLANDTDIDGDLLSVTAVGAPPSGATVSVVGAMVRYLPAAGFSGTESFSYTVSDSQGGTAAALVTVNVLPSETVNTTTAEFRTRTPQWRVAGTSSILVPHQITVTMTGGVGACNGQVLGVVTTDVTGGFDLRLAGVAPELDPRNGNCTNITAVSDRGGSDLITPIVIRR